jgi:HEPN domain-containing protein
MAINTKQKADYWLDMAQYDLVSAKAMLGAKRFLYVGFLCHQVAEKGLKAFFWHSLKKEPPYTHNLLSIAEQSKFDASGHEKFLDLFNELMPLNIQARYPEDKEMLLKTLTKKRCEELYRQTKELNRWIRKLLK